MRSGTGRSFGKGTGSKRVLSPRSAGWLAPPAAPCTISVITIALRIARLQLHADARPRQIGMNRTPARRSESVEQHRFDPHMVEKVFEMAHRQQRAAEVRVQGRGAMRGERHGPRLADRTRLDETG